MWGHNNPSTYNRQHVCHNLTAMPCLCTCCHASLYDHQYTYNNPMTQWYNNNLLPYGGPPQNPANNPLIFHNQDAMINNEFDSWLLNPVNGQDQNFNQYQYQYPGQFINPQSMQQVNYWEGLVVEQQQQQIYDFSTPASLPATVPEVTSGSYSNTADWSRVNDGFSFGNLIEETVASNSNSASLSSEGKGKKPAFRFPPPISRQDRVLRYFEKKKTRKYEKKIKYTSRKTYAQNRPRIRGRFARRSDQVDAQ